MREAHSNNYPTLPQPVSVTDIASLRVGDPTLHTAFQDVLGALKQDMLPAEAALALVEAMPSGVQRDIVNKISGLDASVLMTLKNQLNLVDAVLRRVVNPDGTTITGANRIDITVKEALNMSIRLTQVMTRDLPKMYRVERVQNLEASLFEVVETMLTKDQQDQVLLKLQEKNLEDAKKKEA